MQAAETGSFRRHHAVITAFLWLVSYSVAITLVLLFWSGDLSPNPVSKPRVLRMASNVAANSSVAWADVPPIGVGFGTAALGDKNTPTILHALEAGFRNFDTAEADWWYDQNAVGQALRTHYAKSICEEDSSNKGQSCSSDLNVRSPKVRCDNDKLRISTKIPPWELLSAANIRKRAALSRDELVGFCQDVAGNAKNPFSPGSSTMDSTLSYPYPLDVYYIHAPKCWQGWHTRCDGVGETLSLREVWLALEAVVAIDRSAARIGLSNVSPHELKDIIQFVKERQSNNNEAQSTEYPPPRMPDVLQAYADPIHPAQELREICQQNGIEFVSYSTLGTQHFKAKKNPVLRNPNVLALARDQGKSTAEIVLSWAVQRGMSVIPRSSNPQHIIQLANMLHQPDFLEEGGLSIIDKMALN